MENELDPSCRYILPAGAPLVRNLAALWAVEPKLAAAIERLEGQPPYRVEPSRAGEATVAVRSADGRELYLHSRHQPLDEAKRLIASVEPDKQTAFCIHGFGLGYHVEQLFDAASDEAILAVFEPDLLLLRTAFAQRDFSRLIESRRVFFFWTAEKSEILARLTPHTALLSVGIGFVTHGPSLQLRPDFHRQISEWLAEFVSFCRTNLNTLILNSRRTCENIARNLAWYVAAPGVGRLKDRYRGRPAVIVSAGPSLRRNKHLLKEAEGRAVLIAVQTTLQPLVEMGLRPQFVTSLDYHEASARFFERLPRDLSTELVAEPKASAAVLNAHPGPVCLTGNDLAERLVQELKLDKPRLPSGATVAHLAFYLAEHLGCDPIIFVGQDLGFSDSLFYSPGTSYDDLWRPEWGRFCTPEMKQWEQIIREKPILRKIPDQQGRPMYTEERLFTYLQQFEKDFSRSRARIIDATEGGARKRSAEMMTLADALAQFCTQPLPPAPAPSDGHGGYRWDRVPACIDSLRRRRSDGAEVERISRQTLPMLEEIRDHLANQQRVNRAIARIDALRARMNELAPCYDLITQMTQLTQLQRFQRDRSIAASRVTGMERQRRQVLRDIENVRGVADAAVEFQRLMGEVMDYIAATAPAPESATAPQPTPAPQDTEAAA